MANVWRAILRERAYLKRQVRGRRVRCADGIPSKSVANELGLHEHTVGKWRGRRGKPMPAFNAITRR